MGDSYIKPTSPDNPANNQDGPFLYSTRSENPQTSQAEVCPNNVPLTFQPVCLVQGEEVHVNVLLRNNFEFDLEVVAFNLWHCLDLLNITDCKGRRTSA
jgi:hypothetical protein